MDFGTISEKVFSGAYQGNTNQFLKVNWNMYVLSPILISNVRI
jgi:hypothetical protein